MVRSMHFEDNCVVPSSPIQTPVGTTASQKQMYLFTSPFLCAKIITSLEGLMPQQGNLQHYEAGVEEVIHAVTGVIGEELSALRHVFVVLNRKFTSRYILLLSADLTVQGENHFNAINKSLTCPLTQLPFMCRNSGLCVTVTTQMGKLPAHELDYYWSTYNIHSVRRGTMQFWRTKTNSKTKLQY